MQVKIFQMYYQFVYLNLKFSSSLHNFKEAFIPDSKKHYNMHTSQKGNLDTNLKRSDKLPFMERTENSMIREPQIILSPCLLLDCEEGT